jgi:hypothetical protein
MAKITSCKIRMYTMGTGDCFLLSFFSDEDTVNPQFKLMIDCGVIRISETKMEDYAKDIVTSTNGKIDALLITHEHQDHVLGFERAEKIFTDSSKFEIDELWLPWTENITDPLVDTWNQEYGKKKKALAKATEIFKESLKNSIFNDSFKGVKNGANKIELKKSIFNGLSEMTALNGQPSNEYVGSLKGFDIAKKKIKKNSVRYLEPGTVLEKLDNLENIRIFILGPPKLWKSVSTLEGKGEEVYKHNKALEHLRGISSLPFEEGSDSSPFDEKYVCQNLEDCDCINNVTKQYLNGDIRRRIDFDWLTSTANLAMRVTTGINNLSAVLAIEFIDSGKIMLFPGDAEFGSWQSWHTITWPIWSRTQNFQKVTTAELLNRTIFYKVAHH